MLEASNEYQGNCWLAYNRRFRQQAASQPNCKWSNIDTTYWNLAFTSQAKASRCRHCFSLFHQSKDCEFASSPTSSLPDPRPQMPYRRWYIADTGMNNMAKDVPSGTVAMNMCAITVHNIPAAHEYILQTDIY